MYDEAVVQYFLEHQMQLFKENVAESPEEAEEFLEDCMAVVCKNIKEVRAYFEMCIRDSCNGRFDAAAGNRIPWTYRTGDRPPGKLCPRTGDVYKRQLSPCRYPAG